MKQPISIIIAVVLLLSFAIAEMPEYTGTPMVELNGNIPCFTEDELANCRDVYYYGLDGLGRVGFAIAYIGKNTGNNTRDYTYTIEPTGWNNKQYAFIPNRYLYNRSHLIAHRFAGGGEVQKNLFTGTQYLNQNLMVQVESDVADYIEHPLHDRRPSGPGRGSALEADRFHGRGGHPVGRGNRRPRRCLRFASLGWTPQGFPGEKGSGACDRQGLHGRLLPPLLPAFGRA